MKYPLVALIALAMTSCDGQVARRHVNLATVTYDIPGDWVSQDSNRDGTLTSIWTPGDDNERKESVTIIRTERSALVARSGLSSVGELLRQAQGPGARLSLPEPFVTPAGLRGMSLKATFVPPGRDTSYERIHVVLVDGDVLLHVLYTARNPDPEAKAFHAVLGSIRHEEG